MDNLLDKYFPKYQDSEMYYNRLDFSRFNIDAFNKQYKIYQLCYEGNGYIDFKTRILDDLTEYHQILAVSFVGGKSVYLLFQKDTIINWGEILAQPEYDAYSQKAISLSSDDVVGDTKKMSIVYNLLLNALAQCNNSMSNVSGSLYLYVGEEDTNIIMMKYQVKNGYLIRKQQVFSVYNPNFKTKKPKYVKKVASNNTNIFLKRAKADEGETLYIAGYGMKNHNNRYVTKYDTLKMEHLERTKADLFLNLVKNFKSEYKGIAWLDFYKVPVKTIRIEDHFNKKVKARKSEEYATLGMIDFVELEDCDEIREQLTLFKNFLEQEKLMVVDSQQIMKDGINIVLIHDEEYYQQRGMPDVKDNDELDAVTQYVTIESLKNIKLEKINEENKKKNKKSIKKIENIVWAVLSELVIKKGLQQEKIWEWQFGECEFYLAIRNKSELKEDVGHALLQIAADGSFTIIDDVTKIDSQYTKYIHSAEFSKSSDGFSDGCVCIVKKDNNLNRIIHTECYPILDSESRQYLVDQSKEYKNKYLSKKIKFKQDKKIYPYVGKTTMMIDNELCYTVGNTNTLGSNIPTLNNIYKIERLTDAEGVKSEYIPEILEMLKYIHVRTNNTESVRPYPFKYLIEHMRKTLSNPHLILN